MYLRSQRVQIEIQLILTGHYRQVRFATASCCWHVCRAWCSGRWCSCGAAAWAASQHPSRVGGGRIG